MATPQITIEVITPELAYELLTSNCRNRTLRGNVVAAYARDMSEGRWKAAGEPIYVAADGELLNGQHRLNAVVEAGVSVHLPIMRGVPKDYRMIADQGLRRTTGDVLSIEGEVNSNQLAAALRKLYMFRHTGGFMDTKQPISSVEISELLQREPEIRSWITEGKRLYRAINLNQAVATALLYVLHEIHPSEAPEFVARLVSGTGLAEGDPVLALRKRFMISRPSKPGEQAALVIKAFNSWMERSPMYQLRWDSSQAYPTITRRTIR